MFFPIVIEHLFEPWLLLLLGNLESYYSSCFHTDLDKRSEGPTECSASGPLVLTQENLLNNLLQPNNCQWLINIYFSKARHYSVFKIYDLIWYPQHSTFICEGQDTERLPRSHGWRGNQNLNLLGTALVPATQKGLGHRKSSNLSPLS